MSNTEIRYFQTFDDASGATALVDSTVDGQRFTFACDLLGEIKINLVAPSTGSARSSRIAADQARATYRAELMARTTEEYRARNADMYSDAMS